MLSYGLFTLSVNVNVNAARTLDELFNTPDKSFQITVATHFGVTQSFSMRTESLASSQSCRSVDADVWCKQRQYFLHYFASVNKKAFQDVYHP